MPHLFYEVYPDLSGDSGEAPLLWFEIALHADMEEYQSPDHPKSRAALETLMDLAGDLLHHELPRDRFHLTRSYYTLHLPDDEGSARPRLSRTLSLVFSQSRPFEHRETDRVLEQITNRLHSLNVPRRRQDPGTNQWLHK